MGKILILISCSDEKKTNQESRFQQAKILQQLSPNIKEILLQKRRTIKNYIQEGRVFDLKIKGENRKERESNRMLSDGPDFGKNELEPGYLPAYRRYYGRFFNQFKKFDWSLAKKNGYEIFILSGLYGFVLPEDSIQNYNCHITDSIILNREAKESQENTLQDFWKDTLTKVIADYIEYHNIELIIDLLSEESYQKTIMWERLPKMKVLHRLFKEKSGASILPDLREFMKRELIPAKTTKTIKELQAKYPLQKDYFEGDVLIFENYIGEIKEGYERENFKFDSLIKKRLGEQWNLLIETEKDAFRLAEEFYNKIEDNYQIRPRITAIIQVYWGILENSRKNLLKSLINSYLESKIGDQNENIELTRDIFFPLKKIIKMIIEEECRNFSAYYTELLFNNSLNITSSSFYCYISSKFARNSISAFVNSFKCLRKIRNEYKLINDIKPLNVIKSDLEEFRKILFDQENSPFTKFHKFLEILNK